MEIPNKLTFAKALYILNQDKIKEFKPQRDAARAERRIKSAEQGKSLHFIGYDLKSTFLIINKDFYNSTSKIRHNNNIIDKGTEDWFAVLKCMTESILDHRYTLEEMHVIEQKYENGSELTFVCRALVKDKETDILLLSDWTDHMRGEIFPKPIKAITNLVAHKDNLKRLIESITPKTK